MWKRACPLDQLFDITKVKLESTRSGRRRRCGCTTLSDRGMARPAACRDQIREINLSPGNRETMGKQVRVNMARRFSASHLKTVRDLRQQELTSSFVHLSFVFAGESAKDRTIEMPFALLSTVLASPIVVFRHLTSQAKPVNPV